MSVFDIINEATILEHKFPQYLHYNPELKDLYGEINTPFYFIYDMLSVIPTCQFKNKELKWLDAGAGCGNYSMCLYSILFNALKEVLPNVEERKKHIIENMIFMVEYNPNNIPILRERFGETANIIQGNYLEWIPEMQFDFIIGNPPYNCNGVKKVPTKNNIDKKEDGKTIWTEFVKKNISLLKENGKMNVLIPAIWMKPDKAGIYDLFLKYDIEKLHALNASEVNKIFSYHVQTPVCYFILTKRENKKKTIKLFDKIYNNYINFSLLPNIPIPLAYSSIVNKFLILVKQYGSINVIKTNMPPKNVLLQTNESIEYKYKNIHTTTINKEKGPELQIKYSNVELMYAGKPKIVMAHKMYGFPYVDIEGSYGISSRDNYVIINKTERELFLISEFLSSTLILFLFETTRYRMRYLEKYAFEYIPDFSKMQEAQFMYENKSIDIYKLFGITKNEKEYIERYYKIKYKFFDNNNNNNNKLKT